MTEEEFRLKVLPLRRQMYCLALRMGIPPDDAADAVQDTQIRLWRRRDGIPSLHAELKLYCIAAMRNECLSRIRHKKPTGPIDEAVFESAVEYDEVEYADTRQRMDILISKLPAGQREAIRLSAFGQLDNTEIASRMGQTESNVRQLLSRGRRKLREMMGFGDYK